MICRIVAVMMAWMLFFVEAVIVTVPVFGDFHLKLGVPVKFGFSEFVGQMCQCRIQVGARQRHREDHGEQATAGQAWFQQLHGVKAFRTIMKSTMNTRNKLAMRQNGCRITPKMVICEAGHRSTPQCAGDSCYFLSCSRRLC